MAASRKIYDENEQKDVHNPHTMLVQLYNFHRGSTDSYSRTMCPHTFGRTETDRRTDRQRDRRVKVACIKI